MATMVGNKRTHNVGEMEEQVRGVGGSVCSGGGVNGVGSDQVCDAWGKWQGHGAAGVRY